MKYKSHFSKIENVMHDVKMFVLRQGCHVVAKSAFHHFVLFTCFSHFSSFISLSIIAHYYYTYYNCVLEERLRLTCGRIILDFM
jgi:hypothetical protein